MNILLVNDDGYDAEGIRLLFRLLSKYGNVTIIAPKEPMSAKSVSINIRSGLSFVKEDESIYSLSGSPADCTCFGLGQFGKSFDLVVSGCNHGFNLTYDTLYSGTVGACIEALQFKVKSVAFSCPLNFKLVEKEFHRVMKFILENDLLSTKYLLNVNFPNGDHIVDIKLSKLCHREYIKYYEKLEDGLYYAKRKITTPKYDPDTDCYMSNNHIVSITPLCGDYFDNDVYTNLTSKIK